MHLGADFSPPRWEKRMKNYENGEKGISDAKGPIFWTFQSRKHHIDKFYFNWNMAESSESNGSTHEFQVEWFDSHELKNHWY